MRRRLSLILLFACLFPAAGCAALGPFSPLGPLERSLVYQGDPFPAGVGTPEGVTEARFVSDDGKSLHGWYFEHPQPRAHVLYCHGNAGTVADWAGAAEHLRTRERVSVLVFDYRGYGKSEGSPTEGGILRDARAARRWLAARAGIEERDVVLFGRSLGGAVAVDLAAADGARALVLASTFSSLPDVAAHHVPWLLPRINMVNRLDSAAKINRYSGPLLQCHGESDRLVPIASARKLFDAAPGPKQFVELLGADHNDPPTEEFEAVLDRFLASLD